MLSVFVLAIISARGDRHKFMQKQAIVYLGLKNECKNKPNPKCWNFYKDFLHNLELSFQEEHFNQKTEFSYYVGKCYMCIYFESESLPGHGDALKLV